MWLIVGLGNPGSKYEKTRHNAGFLVVDQIVEPLSVTMAKSAYGGVVATSELFGQKILFLKPMTYMNKSGTAVMQACRFYKIPPEKIIVLHDDIDVKQRQLEMLFLGKALHIGSDCGKEFARVMATLFTPKLFFS